MVAAGEHVGNIERSNRTVKECTRCHIHRCPYERYPRVMVTGCVVKAVKDLNQLPSQSGISQELSPSTLITGDVCPDFKRINALNFGDYVQVHRDITPTNTPRARTVGGIALHPSGNEQGGWIFMSLSTGKKIHGRTWDVLLIGEDIINRVHAIARDENQPMIADNFVFEWRLEGEEIMEQENENDEEDVNELLTNNRREVQIIENESDDINSVEDEFNELEEDEEIPDLESQYSVDSESDDDSDDEDDDENGENYTNGTLTDDHMNIDEKEIVENAGTEENINTDTTAINQGADGCINNNNRESEATIENTEGGDQEKILET